MSICVSKTYGVVADHVFADSGECTGGFAEGDAQPECPRLRERQRGVRVVSEGVHHAWLDDQAL